MVRSLWNRRPGGVEAGSLLDLRSEMDRVFDHFFETSGFGLQPTPGMMSVWAPAMDLAEEDDQLVIRAEVPGMKPEDIDINVAGNELVITGEKKEETEHKREGVYRSECRYGRFHRVVELPNHVDAENVSAEYENGVLTLRIPYAEQSKAKRIEVKAGGGRKHQMTGGTQPGRHQGRSEDNKQPSTNASTRGMGSRNTGPTAQQSSAQSSGQGT